MANSESSDLFVEQSIYLRDRIFSVMKIMQDSCAMLQSCIDGLSASSSFGELSDVYQALKGASNFIAHVQEFTNGFPSKESEEEELDPMAEEMLKMMDHEVEIEPMDIG